MSLCKSVCVMLSGEPTLPIVRMQQSAGFLISISAGCLVQGVSKCPSPTISIAGIDFLEKRRSYISHFLPPSLNPSVTGGMALVAQKLYLI